MYHENTNERQYLGEYRAASTLFVGKQLTEISEQNYLFTLFLLICTPFLR